MAPPPDKLSDYKKKRDFRKTGEPSDDRRQVESHLN